MQLTTQTQSLNQALVTVHVLALQVIEQLAPLIDQPKKAATRVVILFVFDKMGREVINPSSQQGDLYFWGAGIIRCTLIIFHNGTLVGGGIRHHSTPKNRAFNKRIIVAV